MIIYLVVVWDGRTEARADCSSKGITLDICYINLKKRKSIFFIIFQGNGITDSDGRRRSLERKSEERIEL